MERVERLEKMFEMGLFVGRGEEVGRMGVWKKNRGGGGKEEKALISRIFSLR